MATIFVSPVRLVLIMEFLAAVSMAFLPMSNATKGQISSIKVHASLDQINITLGDALVVINKSPWQLTTYDVTTGQVVLNEVSEEKHRLGFGKWEGEYLNIYEGYLFRIGAIIEWHYAKDVLHYTTSPNSVSLNVSTSDPKGCYLNVNISAEGDRQFRIDVSVEGKDSIENNRVGMAFITPDNEGFYGFGERFNDVNQRGHVVGSWLEDGNWGLGVFEPDTWKLRVPKGELSTYCPMPLLISTGGYGLQMDTFFRTVFDLAKSTQNVMSLLQETNKLNLIVYLGRTPLETFTMQVKRNGQSLIPPPWVFAPWNQLASEKQGVSIVDRAKQLLLEEDIPCSHCVDTVHFFPYGGQKGREEQLKTQNKNLSTLGIKSTAYFNAMLETSYSELYDVAANKGYFVKNKNGQPYNFSYIGASSFRVSQMDYTNAEAVKWYQSQLQGALDIGYHGWMYDYGEYTPPYSTSSDGSTGLEMHNNFPLLYQKTAFDFFKKFDGNPTDQYAADYMFYVRSSYTGSQRYTWAHWTGDPSSDWSYASGLPAQIVASINIGLSGMPFSGSDIGGFEWYVDPPPDLELWSRWTQAGCFSGLMHEQGGGKGEGAKTHIFDWAEGSAIWRKFAKLRMQLFPYIYTQAHIAHNTGLPIMRQHILHFPNDSKAIMQSQQYMFGESILAAPVVKEGATKWDVYLPTYGDTRGPTWLDGGSTTLYDEKDGRFRIGFNKYYKGGQTVTVDAPLDISPWFVLAGTIVPAMDPTIMTLNNATNPAIITWQQMKNLSYLWVWSDENLSASGHTYSGCVYSMMRTTTNQVDFHIDVAKGVKVTHIIQIAANWQEYGGKPKEIYTGSSILPFFTSWGDVVFNTTKSSWSFDGNQNVVWVRLTPIDTSFKMTL